MSRGTGRPRTSMIVPPRVILTRGLRTTFGLRPLEDLVVLDQRVGQQLLAHRVELRLVLDVELHQPPDVDVLHTAEPERGQRALDRDALRVEDPLLRADEDPRPHAPVLASHASNGSPVIFS